MTVRAEANQLALHKKQRKTKFVIPEPVKWVTPNRGPPEFSQQCQQQQTVALGFSYDYLYQTP